MGWRYITDENDVMEWIVSLSGDVCPGIIWKQICPNKGIKIDIKYTIFHWIWSAAEYPMVAFFTNIPGKKLLGMYVRVNISDEE